MVIVESVVTVKFLGKVVIIGCYHVVLDGGYVFDGIEGEIFC